MITFPVAVDTSSYSAFLSAPFVLPDTNTLSGILLASSLPAAMRSTRISVLPVSLIPSHKLAI